MPAPQIYEEIVEVVKAVKNVPQKRISARICEQIVGAPVRHAVDELVSLLQEETAEVVQLSPGTSGGESDEGSFESDGLTPAEVAELRYLRQIPRWSLFARW